MTRGLKLNNPGNIRYVKGILWHGQSMLQTDADFVQFDDPIYGIRAIARILRSYQRQGLDTLGEAIDRWAPPNENNSLAYVTDVCERCGVQPDDKVDFGTIMPQLVKAIIRHENGSQPYTDTQINEGISLS